MLTALEVPAAWRVTDLETDTSWKYRLDDVAQTHLKSIVRKAYVPNRPLFDYRFDEFDLGPAAGVLNAAFAEAKHGRGLAFVRGLPRDGLSEEEFRVMNWGIGLHMGVARPQGLASHYMSEVRDVGTDYRTASGRGYSSNAKLDFHVDDADIVTLSCYNRAKSGGQSMITSGISAMRVLLQMRPDLLDATRETYYFSHQNEQPIGDLPYYTQPLFSEVEGRIFCKLNRNRVNTAQMIKGVPALTPAQRETLDLLDDIVRLSELMYSMFLEPGDLQILNNHVVTHSRTEYVDFDEKERKRLLFRLWLAPPDSVLLPESWRNFYGAIEPGAVRGGIRGQAYDDACVSFERRQARTLGMAIPG